VLRRQQGNRNLKLIDSPGIFPLQTSKLRSNCENLYKLICTNLVNPTFIDTKDMTVAAEYLLFKLNQSRNFRYVTTLGLSGPKEKLSDIASARWTPRKFIAAFNSGSFGALMFDDLSQPPS